MPDHIHFFAAPSKDEAKSLSSFMGYWKRSTQKRLRALAPTFSWQTEFFDHLLRNEETYEQKWNYVRDNPVRAGLVAASEDWPYQGEINIIRW
jgi:REP element-mobilizing transposase RayT